MYSKKDRPENLTTSITLWIFARGSDTTDKVLCSAGKDYFIHNFSHFTNIIKFYILTIIVSNVLFDRIVSAVRGQCPISKPGNPNGEATLFQV